MLVLLLLALLLLLMVLVATVAIVAIVVVVAMLLLALQVRVAVAVVVAVVVVMVGRAARSVDDSLGIKPKGALGPSFSVAAAVAVETTVAAAAALPRRGISAAALFRMLGLEGAITVVADLCSKNDRVLSKVRRRRLKPRWAAAEPVVPLVLLLLPSRGFLP